MISLSLSWKTYTYSLKEPFPVLSSGTDNYVRNVSYIVGARFGAIFVSSYGENPSECQQMIMMMTRFRPLRQQSQHQLTGPCAPFYHKVTAEHFELKFSLRASL